MNYAIILAGGKGSRFWPLSRECFPKQFLRIVNNQTLLEAAIKRAKIIIPPKNIFIVTSRPYLKEIINHLRKSAIPRSNIILEPVPKNTLPAIAICAQLISLKDRWAKLLVFPSDHYIKDNAVFSRTMHKALRICGKGLLCLMGIRPDKPATGYGYIKTGKRIEEGVFYGKSFIEKPTAVKAAKLYKRKGIFWNSGMFCFTGISLLEEVRRHAPMLYTQIKGIKRRMDVAKIWPGIKPVSIDYGILEKSSNLAVVTAELSWCDLGSWDVLYDILPKDRDSNVRLCEYVGLGSNNNLICSSNAKRLIATIGLKETVIVDTPDALLVCKKSEAQDIKRLVEVLKKKKKACV